MPCAGTPAKPAISQAAGSDATTASISISKAFTAVNYTITLVDVNTPTNTASEVLTPAAGEAGPWTRTLTAPAKGTYRFEVRCCAGCCEQQLLMLRVYAKGGSVLVKCAT